MPMRRCWNRPNSLPNKTSPQTSDLTHAIEKKVYILNNIIKYWDNKYRNIIILFNN